MRLNPDAGLFWSLSLLPDTKKKPKAKGQRARDARWVRRKKHLDRLLAPAPQSRSRTPPSASLLPFFLVPHSLSLCSCGLQFAFSPLSPFSFYSKTIQSSHGNHGVTYKLPAKDATGKEGDVVCVSMERRGSRTRRAPPHRTSFAFMIWRVLLC